MFESVGSVLFVVGLLNVQFDNSLEWRAISMNGCAMILRATIVRLISRKGMQDHKVALPEFRLYLALRSRFVTFFSCEVFDIQWMARKFSLR